MKTFILFLLLLLTIIFAVGYWIPTDYVIHKNIVIPKPPSLIHKYVGDLEKWQQWAPWKAEDPNIDITISDRVKGIGASQSWEDAHGGGSLVFTYWSPENGVEYDLFFNGGKYKCKAAIKYQPISDSKTKVNWTAYGDINIPIIGGYLAYYMKYSIGSLFKKGLEDLKKNIKHDK